MMKTIAEKMRNYQVAPSGCWEWQGDIASVGYGRVSIKGVRYWAHRVAWEIANGIAAGSAVIMHSCDNPKCVNPSHLSAGTQSENLKDMWNKGREKIVSGERHGKSRLTEQQVKAILVDTRQPSVVAKEHGIACSHVSSIKSGRLWGHINVPLP
jgi:hypothetical protein